jgi:hypothetical protein
MIITTQGFDRYEIFQKVGSDKNIAKSYGGSSCGQFLVAGVRDRE